jgi:hypothetical protein
MDELTPWEEINPPTALAPQQGQPSPYSVSPASPDLFRNELTACLALVAPAGMAEEARRDWLTVAWGTLGHLPADLLIEGCAHARKVADHPAKVVPAIISVTEDRLVRRREYRQSDGEHKSLPAPTKRHLLDRRGEAMSQEDTDELNRILEQLGAAARYRADGSRYTVLRDE